jgi:hypothetical protein
MRPIFTVHAGEYIVGNHIEARFPRFKVWVPSKDDGVDLLVTDCVGTKVASLQIKFSKDHLATGNEPNATRAIKSGGWWRFDLSKIEQSPADYWVLVLCNFTSRQYDFVVIQPNELAARYRAIAPGVEKIQSYFWVLQTNHCWETRGLGRADIARVCNGEFNNNNRNFTDHLNKWPFMNAQHGAAAEALRLADALG